MSISVVGFQCIVTQRINRRHQQPKKKQRSYTIVAGVGTLCVCVQSGFFLYDYLVICKVFINLFFDISSFREGFTKTRFSSGKPELFFQNAQKRPGEVVRRGSGCCQHLERSLQQQL